MANGQKRWFRSALAVVAGVVANFLIAVPIDIALHAAGVYPESGDLPDSLCLLALSYRVAAAVAGGYITARLAPFNPVRHAVILGCVGVVLSTIGTVAMWDVGPHWYPLTLVAMSVPCSMAGARIFSAR